ncbi:hypothetical protein N7534_003133 [Penicillium rubens]|nr:hypothetical protein N7534_003133 [Penicillium rubens]
MAETQAQSHAFLRSLIQQAKDLEPDFPSPDDFQRLGVQVVQVPLAPENDQGLQFEPCFFRPHPDKLFQKHPIHPLDLENDPQNIQYSETLKDYIEDALTEHSPENAPIIARMEYEMSPHQRENDPLTYEGVEDPKPWQVVNHNRYTSRPLKPHSIMSCLAQLWPDASQGLSTHELRAIVNTMLLRVNHNPFRKCHIHPILVLSFMGDYQGRIIQASYDGKGLILQYSQLWSFADIKKAPVELFVRYRLSQTVGGIRTLS